MPKQELTIETAKELLHARMHNINLRRHCYAVGFALAEYFDYYKGINRDVGGLSRDQWQIIGTLHDADWEATKEKPEEHTLELLKWLEDYDVPEEVQNVFKSHNSEITRIRKPQTTLEWTLECCDELTGFIVACALVTPEKKLELVKPESVLKKFKQKEFARAVNRDQILQCEKVLNVSTDDFIQTTLSAMKKHATELGL